MRMVADSTNKNSKKSGSTHDDVALLNMTSHVF
jgi:hypothetical protein